MSTVRYARISLTPYCPLRCRYCIAEGEAHGNDGRGMLEFNEVLQLIDIFEIFGVKKFRFTGGEPFARKGVMDFFRRLKLDNWGVTTSLAVENIAGQINNSPVDNINVSLDTLDESGYSWITGGGKLEIVLDNLKKLKNKKIKLNTILIEDFNYSEAEKIISFAHRRGFIPRFIEKMNLFSAGDGLKSASLSLLEKELLQRGVVSGRAYRQDSSAAFYRLSPYSGLPVGFITPLSAPFCGSCDRIRLSSSGELKSCLFAEAEADIAPALKAGRKEVEKIIKEFLKMKFPARKEDAESLTMSGIGG